jgi:hypothetical protein
MDPLSLTASLLLGHITGAAAARLRGPHLLTLGLLPTVAVTLPWSSPWGPLFAGTATLGSVVLAARGARTPARGDALTQEHGLILAFLILCAVVLIALATGGVPGPVYAALVGGASGILASTQARGAALPGLPPHPWASRSILAVCVLLSFTLGASLTEWVGLLCAGLCVLTFTLTRWEGGRA